jgi:hypothetical protein
MRVQLGGRIAAVVFRDKETIFVDNRLSDVDAHRAAALVLARCTGVFALLTLAELMVS